MDEIARITRLLKRIKSVKAAILFGSRARGRTRKDSDIDICVITDKDDDSALELSSDIFDISRFETLPIVIRYHVFRDGKVLFCRDKAILTKLKFWTITQYLDEKHWRDAAVAKVLA